MPRKRKRGTNTSRAHGQLQLDCGEPNRLLKMSRKDGLTALGIARNVSGSAMRCAPRIADFQQRASGPGLLLVPLLPLTLRRPLPAMRRTSTAVPLSVHSTRVSRADAGRRRPVLERPHSSICQASVQSLLPRRRDHVEEQCRLHPAAFCRFLCSTVQTVAIGSKV